MSASRSTRRAPSATSAPASARRLRERDAQPAGGAGDDGDLAVESESVEDGSVGHARDPSEGRAAPSAHDDASARCPSPARSSPSSATGCARTRTPIRTTRPGSARWHGPCPGTSSTRSSPPRTASGSRVVTFADRPSHEAWARHPEHREAQRAGVRDYYEEYSISVGVVDRASHWSGRLGRRAATDGPGRRWREDTGGERVPTPIVSLRCWGTSTVPPIWTIVKRSLDELSTNVWTHVTTAQVIPSTRTRRSPVDKFDERRNELAESALLTLGRARLRPDQPASTSRATRRSATASCTTTSRTSSSWSLYSVTYYKMRCIDPLRRGARGVDHRAGAPRRVRAKLVETMIDEAPMHRLWYDLRVESMFDDQAPRRPCCRIDAATPRHDLADRHPLLRARRPSRSAMDPASAYGVLDGLFEAALLGHVTGDSERAAARWWTRCTR